MNPKAHHVRCGVRGTEGHNGGGFQGLCPQISIESTTQPLASHLIGNSLYRDGQVLTLVIPSTREPEAGGLL